MLKKVIVPEKERQTVYIQEIDCYYQGLLIVKQFEEIIGVIMCDDGYWRFHKNPNIQDSDLTEDTLLDLYYLIKKYYKDAEVYSTI